MLLVHPGQEPIHLKIIIMNQIPCVVYHSLINLVKNFLRGVILAGFFSIDYESYIICILYPYSAILLINLLIIL